MAVTEPRTPCDAEMGREPIECNKRQKESRKTMSNPRSALPGSDRHELRPREAHASVHPDQRHEVTVMTSANLTADEYDSLASFANGHGLVVVTYERHKRRMVLSGRTPNMEAAFGVELHHRDHEGGTHVGHYGPVTVPTDLLTLVEGVFGLDNRPAAKPHYRKLSIERRRHHAALAWGKVHAVYEHELSEYGHMSEPHRLEAREAEAAAFKKPPGTFTPLDLAKLYDFPAGDGSGQCIGLLELGGGYKVADFQKYAQEMGQSGYTVSAVLVDHAKNQTGSDADGEVMLDIEVAAAIAPKAHIVVYFAPNTDQGFLDAISAAIHDTHNKPSVISISWGGPESSYSTAAINSMDKLFQEASAAGITVLAAAGDDGSSDGVDDGRDHVDFPASSPNVLACGGTKLVVSGTTLTETVWNELAIQSGATGGGVSSHFPVPTWQKHAVPAGTNGRCVPDVSALGDPTTGYTTRVDGQDGIVGGTSCVAPLLAGLVARLNQHKRVGALNPTLYAHSVCRDITSGNNGTFHAGPAYDMASGLGVIDGAKLAAALS